MRIFDNPNHPQYGPVRRMWVILKQLDLISSGERYPDSVSGRSWDESLALRIETGRDKDEAMSQRIILRRILTEC